MGRRTRRLLIVVALAIVAGTAAWFLWVRLPGNVLAGHFVEYKMPTHAATPTAIAAAPDGTIWFTVGSTDWIGRVRNGTIEQVPTGGDNLDPIGLAVAADGSAWFTDIVGRGLAHVTPAGVVTRFGLDDPVVRLARLAIAPDGAVWFAESTENSVSVLREGSVVRHDIETPRGAPYGVAIAPNGDVWAALQGADQLVRIAGESRLDVLDVPTRAAGPTDIAIGPDGAIWFIEFRANSIARYKEGKFEEFSLGGDSVGASGLVVAADGAVWVGEVRTASLVRWRNGEFATFPLPRPDARPYTLATDRDGNIWYADISGTVGMLPAADALK
jgi:virginiamycin B lyase